MTTRCRVAVDRRGPPFISTNIDTWCIDIRDFKLFFFPDHIFVLQRKTYGTVSYDSVNMIYMPTRFIEDGRVPNDAEQVGYTWKYVNKGGGPDRRFRNNHQIPIVVYGFLQITSVTGFNIHLHVSNKSIAENFSKIFSSVRNQSFYEDSQRRSTTEERRIPKYNEVESRGKSTYEILGIKAGASLLKVAQIKEQ